MILSHRHRFIFIKTFKTAGTSLEIALSRYCGPDDVITPILYPEDNRLRRELGYRGQQHYHIPWSRHSAGEKVTALLKRRRIAFFNHCSARMVRNRIDPDIWRSYFKFCVERNPWDKAVSAYYWEHQVEPRPPFAEFLHQRYGGALAYDLYSLDGVVALDQVYRFEAMDEMCRDLGQRLGLPGPLELPRTKTVQRKDRRHYREVLAPAERDQIAIMAAREIAAFGYRW
jgi:hypothetical protein